jgi:putative oxidoreductase
MIRWLAGTENDFAALIMRLTLGIVFFPHGAQKVLGIWGGGGPQGTIQAFQQYFNMPAWLTILVMAAEFAGSIMLVLGLGTRLAAIGVGAVMAGAIIMVHAKFGFFMNWYGKQAGEGFEFHLLALGLVLALIIKGGGALSVDRLIARR